MSLSVEWMFIHAILQGGIPKLNRAMKLGLKPKHLGDFGSDLYRVYNHILVRNNGERVPNAAEIFTAVNVAVPACDWECDLDIYADAVRKQHLREQVLQGCEDIVSKVERDPDTARDMLQNLFLETAMDRSLAETRTNNPETIDLIYQRYLDAKERRLSNKVVGLSSPWPKWDHRSRGLQPGQVTVFLAKRGAGKTQLSLVQLIHTWTSNDLDPGDKIMFISMENSKGPLLDRIGAIRLGIDYEMLCEGALTEAEENRLKQFRDDFQTPDPMRPEMVFYFSNEIKTVNDIVLRCREHKPKLVVIDGLYLLNKGSKKQRWEKVTDTAEGIKDDLAVGCNVPVIETAQLKSGIDAGDFGAKGETAKYASAILDSADVAVILAGGPDSDLPRNERVFIAQKGREFKLPFGLRINFDMTTGDYSEIEEMDFEDAGAFGSGDEIDV